jgi:hypothetical protein
MPKGLAKKTKRRARPRPRRVKVFVAAESHSVNRGGRTWSFSTEPVHPCSVSVVAGCDGKAAVSEIWWDELSCKFKTKYRGLKSGGAVGACEPRDGPAAVIAVDGTGRVVSWTDV